MSNATLDKDTLTTAPGTAQMTIFKPIFGKKKWIFASAPPSMTKYRITPYILVIYFEEMPS